MGRILIVDDDPPAARALARMLPSHSTTICNAPGAAALLFAESVFDVIERYAPRFRSLIEHKQVLTPLDLERRFGITGGNIFHGEMSLDQMFALRPVAGWARYRTPITGHYLCGAGAHPGGGVMGAPGHNAAAAILKDRKR